MGVVKRLVFRERSGQAKGKEKVLFVCFVTSLDSSSPSLIVEARRRRGVLLVHTKKP